MSGALGYFTIPVADVKRGRAFYGGLFGWQFAPDATDAYAHITNTAPAGGLHGSSASSPQVWFRVDDIAGRWRACARSAATPTHRRRARRAGTRPAATTRARTSTCGSRRPATDGGRRHAGFAVAAVRWPKLARHVERVHTRPSFKALIDEESAAVSCRLVAECAAASQAVGHGRLTARPAAVGGTACAGTRRRHDRATSDAAP